MAFYKCIPFGKSKTVFIEDNILKDSYTRTSSYLGSANTGTGVKFTPNPSGTWATARFSIQIPSSAKTVKFTAYGSYINCGYIGVSRDPNAKGPGQCLAGLYINRTSSGTTAIDYFDISAYNEPLYLVVCGYYDFYVKEAYAE